MGQYLLDLPDELHMELKILAIREKTTLKELLIKALVEYLKSAKKKGGK